MLDPFEVEILQRASETFDVLVTNYMRVEYTVFDISTTRFRFTLKYINESRKELYYFDKSSLTLYETKIDEFRFEILQELIPSTNLDLKEFFTEEVIKQWILKAPSNTVDKEHNHFILSPEQFPPITPHKGDNNNLGERIQNIPSSPVNLFSYNHFPENNEIYYKGTTVPYDEEKLKEEQSGEQNYTEVQGQKQVKVLTSETVPENLIQMIRNAEKDSGQLIILEETFR